MSALDLPSQILISTKRERKLTRGEGAENYLDALLS